MSSGRSSPSIGEGRGFFDGRESARVNALRNAPQKIVSGRYALKKKEKEPDNGSAPSMSPKKSRADKLSTHVDQETGKYKAP